MQFSLQNLFRRLTGRCTRQRPARSRPRSSRRGARLRLEQLEQRLVPTIVFQQSLAGPETITPGWVNDGMQSPTVNLIFAGSNWGNYQQAETPLINATQTLLQGPYFSALTLYGSNGKATWGTSWADATSTLASPTNPSASQLQAFLQSSILRYGSDPGSLGVQQAPIYIVAVDPQDSGNNYGGYNELATYSSPNGGSENIHMIYCQTYAPNGSVSVDAFTQTICHEIAETMSDPTSLGTTCTLPPAYDINGQPKEVQICDGEQEHNYGAIVNGDVVQAYFSAQNHYPGFPTAGTAIIPNFPYSSPQVNFYVEPVWNAQQQILLGYQLTVDGGQLANPNDTITIGENADGGVLVTEDGQSASFLPGPDSGLFAGVTAITVNTGTGKDTINVEALPANVQLTINDEGTDTLNFGTGGSSSTTLGVQGLVTIANTTAASTTLTINDSGNTTSDQFVVSKAYGLGAVQEVGSPGSILFSYAGTASLTLETGLGGDNQVFVTATAVTTNVLTQPMAGNDVLIGEPSNGNLETCQSIQGTVNVSSSVPKAPAFNYIFVDDSADSTALPEPVTLSTYTPKGDTSWGSITGLAPASINYRYANTQNIALLTGNAANTFDVLATGVTTFLSEVDFGPSGFANTISVGNGGSAQALKGSLNISNPNAANTLTVDDSSDKSNKTVTLGTLANPGSIELYQPNDPWGTIQGLAPAAINYDYPDTAGITINGGGGKNTYDVQAATVPTILNTGSGNDAVNLGDVNQLQFIVASLTVAGQGGTDTLTANDQASSAAQSYSVNAGLLYVRPLSMGITYSGISDLVLKGSQGASSYNIQSTAASTGYEIDAGKLNDSFNIAPFVQDCDGVANMGMTLNGGTGTNTLTVYDGHNTNPAAYNVNAGVLYVRPLSLGITYSHIQSVVVNGGQGGNTFNVYSTAAGTTYTLNGGAGGATFDVGQFGSNTLDTILGAVTLNGQGGLFLVNLNDQGTTAAHTYTLNSSTLARTGMATITYNGETFHDSTVNINTGSAGSSDVINVDGAAVNDTYTSIYSGGNGNEINVLATNAGSFLAVYGGVGSGNLIRVGSAAHGAGDLAAHGGTLANIGGGLYCYPSPGGTNNLVLDDSGDKAAHPSVNFGYSEISGLFPGYMYYDVTTSFITYGGSGATVWNVNGLPAYFTADTLYTGTGSDTVNVNVGDNYGEGLTVHGQGKTDVLNVNDQTISDVTTYNVTSTSVTRTTLTAAQNYNPEVFTLTYDGLTALTINGGSAANTFSFLGTALGTAYTANAGPGNFLGVGNAAGTLDDIQGPVTINGTDNAAKDEITEDFGIGDANSGSGHTYTLSADPSISPTANQLVRSGAAPITYTGIATLQLTGAIGFADTYNIESVANNYLTRFYGGGGLDKFNISPIAHNLDNLTGILDLAASAPGQTTGDVTYTVNDQGHSLARNWIYYTNASQLAGEMVAYPSAGSSATGLAIYFNVTVGVCNGVTVNGGSGGNTFTVQGTPSVVPQTINGGAGVNTLIGPNTTNTWNISGANSGSLDGSLNYAIIGNLVGGTGVDVFQIAAAGTATSINGGGAPAGMGDWLDYSSFTTAVTVNLATGSATNVNGGAAGAVSNIQNVYGGSGGSNLTGDSQGNILVGGSGADTITGGSGRSLLIGDGSSGQIAGGSSSGGDILIGGTTSYDSDTAANEAAFMAILAEWQSADSYSTRFTDINNGTIPGGYSLNYGTTVQNDGVANVLTGAASAVELDWYFGGPQDTLVNWAPGEHVNNT